MTTQTYTADTIVDAALMEYSDTLTAYQIHTIVNLALLLLNIVGEDGQPMSIKAQAVYNSTKSHRATGDGRFDKATAKAVTMKVLNNKIKGGRQNVTDLAAKVAQRLQETKAAKAIIDSEVVEETKTVKAIKK